MYIRSFITQMLESEHSEQMKKAKLKSFFLHLFKDKIDIQQTFYLDREADPFTWTTILFHLILLP